VFCSVIDETGPRKPIGHNRVENRCEYDVCRHGEPFGGDQFLPVHLRGFFLGLCVHKGFIVNLCKNSESRIKQIICFSYQISAISHFMQI